MARAAAITLAVALAGCGGRPDGVMEPTTLSAEGTSNVDMLVVTTRNPTADPARPFGGERGDHASMNRVVVSIPPASVRQVGEIQWPTSSPADPAKSFAVVHNDSIADRDGRPWFRATGKRRVLLFVHGFNTRYEEAVYRFAQIVHDSGTDFAPVLFTWPSRGSVFDYVYDRESTNWSRDTLENLLRAAGEAPDVSEVTVMAHSMGSWLALEALRGLAIHGGVPKKIGNVILASPDLDVDVFERQIRRIGATPRVTLFVSRDDKALGLSKRLAGGVDRLGAIDPTQEPYRSRLEGDGVTVLDLTALQTGDRLAHGKFAESPEVVRLLGSRLIAGQKVSEDRVGLADRLGAVAMGAAGTVGSAASLAVSAPIAVFDPDTRAHLGDRIGDVGRRAGGTVSPLVGE
ncbi:MAG: alpha/beta hydrolase [Siculibacillus sp.]|nr:alpha/beta hydrolase [Siculibacillus sp.]